MVRLSRSILMGVGALVSITLLSNPTLDCTFVCIICIFFFVVLH